ncbi:TPA: prepilin-type N-terminal cleavage/methylation domain-containing protein [Clostridioides difficile]|uniref:Type IV pilin n=2 Tax=Clostridioides difficile TaxID=1496 RepID=Q181A5_CLOD6|nr:prepilin-type N-terminal cleavage/methylation domain-containing protein [Clostridioides difficile]EQF58012.1 prepilin-type N-terminal cleavage/methylation domain protein [Clostridioides difficile CD196]AJP13285.1 putative type IV pilin [Clostridioides difficile 630]ARE64500.1 putative type IV pilin [Clostridioides difficile]AXB66449.1 type IV pilin [Clostridioides difficile]EGT3659876.1 prepilin-type N-terminal cleavage/methylation domain-containing protein [Clostridioides difficile]
MSKKNSERGFSLIEVLVAMAIMGIVLFAFFNIINTNNKANTKNDTDITSLNYVQSEIENLREKIKSGEFDFDSLDKLEDGTVVYEKLIDKSKKVVYDKVLSEGDVSLYDTPYEKITTIKDEDGNLIDKGNITNKIKTIVEDKSGQIYKITVTGKSMNDYSSKKEVKIVTEIFKDK